jgi:hypothetical protein
MSSASAPTWYVHPTFVMAHIVNPVPADEAVGLVVIQDSIGDPEISIDNMPAGSWRICGKLGGRGRGTMTSVGPKVSEVTVALRLAE